MMLRGSSALTPRLIRGRRILVATRGKACPVLNVMRNTLPPLLQQLVPPVLQLRSDCFNAGGLLDGADFDAPGVVSARWRFRQLHHGMFRVRIETFTKFGEDFDGRADLGGGGSLHNQIWMPRENVRAGFCRRLGVEGAIQSAWGICSAVTGCAHGDSKPSLPAASSAALLDEASTTVRRGSPNSRAYSRSV